MKPFLMAVSGGVIHDARHCTEQCNLDDAKKLRKLTRESIEAAFTVGLPTFCKHCWPDEV